MLHRQLTALVAALAALPAVAAAQIDYRNLDDDRPVRVEDTQPVEQYAFEFLFPYSVEREKAGGFVHAFVPELAYGLLPNFHLGVKAPVALLDEAGTTRAGLSGLRAFALYNFNVETGVLPAAAVRLDAAFPVGEFGGSDTRVAMTGILSRSFGMTRVHANGAYRLGPDGTPGLVESLPRWWAGLAVDRTLFRQSLLLVLESHVEQATDDAPLAVTGAAGLRWQWTPTTVLDLGVARGLREALGPEVAFTIGLSHVFAIRALVPGAR